MQTKTITKDGFRGCGTCRRWEPEDQTKRPASLRSIGKGTCRLSGEDRHADEMHGCFGWAQADDDEMKRREGTE